jgi:hypothetical protein
MKSYADIALSLFSLECPQTIGSLVSFTASKTGDQDVIDVDTCILPKDDFGVGRQTFTDLHTYFSWLVAIKKQQLKHELEQSSAINSKEVQANGHDHLPSESLWTRLQSLVSREISRLPAATLRIVPVHQDFDSQNVVINSTTGCITGVFDWEYHALLPAALAAGYPSWIECSAESNQTSEKENFIRFWLVSRERAPQLRAEYEKVSHLTRL